MEKLVPLYVTTCIIRDKLENDQKVLAHHAGLRALIEWVSFNNMVLGIPAAHTPFFSVEHTDGSPLTEDELAPIQGAGSRDAYATRIARSWSGPSRLPPSAFVPESGLVNQVSIRLHQMGLQRKQGYEE